MAFSAPAGSTAPKSNISGFKTRQLPNFTPEQMKLFSSLVGGVQGGAGKGLDLYSKLAGGDEGAFEQLEAPAYSSFQKSLGQIGSRFSGLGAMGSSAFQNATSGAAADLSERLQGQRMGIQQSAIDKLLGLSTSLLGQQPYENIQEQKRSGWDTAGDITSMIAKILPLFL